MKRATIAGGGLAAVFVLLALAAVYRAGRPDAGRTTPPAPVDPRESGAVSEVSEISGMSDPAGTAEGAQGFLYGRVTTTGGATHEGRLRFGGDQEAFWSDYFNGFKDENPWAALVPSGRLPVERYPIELFGMVLAQRERPAGLGRPFMARFGEIARIEARGGRVRVTLKSGAVFDLDRFEASDFDDGLRVWDARGGVFDLDSLQIRAIELLPTGGITAAPHRLHGTVRTRQGDFTGFLQWDREECLGTDELDGQATEGELRLRFDSIRSIARRAPASSLVTLRDGREILLSGGSAAGEENRGIYVDDRRYGRVLVSWETFERVDFVDFRDGSATGAAASGPAYGDFPPGQPLTGSVTTRDGRRLAGRLVYDLDESATTETLDAPFRGVDYTLPFGRVGSIARIAPNAPNTSIAPNTPNTPNAPEPSDPPSGREAPGDAHVRVTLHDGEELRLEPAGDLGAGNAGMLVFVDGLERPEYVPWTEVDRVDFGRPPAVDPVLGGL